MCCARWLPGKTWHNRVTRAHQNQQIQHTRKRKPDLNMPGASLKTKRGSAKSTKTIATRSSRRTSGVEQPSSRAPTDPSALIEAARSAWWDTINGEYAKRSGIKPAPGDLFNDTVDQLMTYAKLDGTTWGDVTPESERVDLETAFEILEAHNHSESARVVQFYEACTRLFDNAVRFNYSDFVAVTARACRERFHELWSAAGLPVPLQPTPAADDAEVAVKYEEELPDIEVALATPPAKRQRKGGPVLKEEEEGEKVEELPASSASVLFGGLPYATRQSPWLQRWRSTLATTLWGRLSRGLSRASSQLSSAEAWGTRPPPTAQAAQSSSWTSPA